MDKQQLSIIFSLVFISPLFSQTTYKYTLCTTSRYFDACEQINRTNSIQCIILGDEASCIERVNRGEASFASLSAEGAFLGSSRPNLVTLARFERNSERFDYQTAIITNTRIENGLASLKNFSYCHPGLDTTEATPLTLTEFERQLITDNEIDICEVAGGTLAENHIKAINDFFGPSCRPGKWVQDESLDKTLKERYPKLTELCNTAPYQNNIGGAFSQSFECLLASNQPRVALTTVSTITTEWQTRNFTVYAICRNGTVSNSTNALCEWTNIPHRIVVANRDNLGQLSAEFRTWFTNTVESNVSNPITLTDAQRTLLKSVIYPDPATSYDIVVDGIQTLPEFLSTFRENLTIAGSRQCKNETRWCTISDNEFRKCQVWSRAGLNYGIQPVLSCVLKDNKRECIDAIAANTADAVSIAADFGYFAKKAGLTSIAFPETVESGLVRSVLLVKKGNITRLENLKGKRGCFPRYGGAAWFSFIAATRSVILSNTTCDYAKLLSYALGHSCMPGMKTTTNLDNVCTLCASRENASIPNCSADSSNLYFGNQGALDCLRDVGDFAVITLQDGLVVPENVTVMCKNGTTTGNNSLSIDNNCFLSIITSSEIVARRGDLGNSNLQLSLLDYDRFFAVDIRAPFKLFGVFDGVKDLLFKDSTPGLDLPSSSNQAITNYIALFSHIDDCLARSNGHQLLPSLILSLASLKLLLWM